MPVHVVMEQPHGRPLVRLRHGVAELVGVVLILVGWAIVPVIAVLVALSHAKRKDGPSPAVGHGTVIAAVVGVVVLIAVVMVVGLQLVRGSRRLVLFLRRFGYADATHALTFAAATTIGRSWRLVTLDDAAVAPVGVSRGPARASAAVGVGSKWVGRTWNTVLGAGQRVGTLGMAGMWAVCGYVYLRHRSVGAMLEEALTGHHRLHHDAAGVFQVSFLVTMAALIVTGFFVIAFFLSTLLVVPWLFLTFSQSALRDAEQAKVTRVVSVDGAHRAARAVQGRARKIFCPRLMVLNVDSDVWRPAVQSVAEVASVVLIDVSEPTDNLLWEIAEVERDATTACVLVGNADRLRSLGSSDEPLVRQLVALLDGRTVLAYETTKDGMRRFARALRATLEVAV